LNLDCLGVYISITSKFSDRKWHYIRDIIKDFYEIFYTLICKGFQRNEQRLRRLYLYQISTCLLLTFTTFLFYTIISKIMMLCEPFFLFTGANNSISYRMLDLIRHKIIVKNKFCWIYF